MEEHVDVIDTQFEFILRKNMGKINNLHASKYM